MSDEASYTEFLKVPLGDVVPLSQGVVLYAVWVAPSFAGERADSKGYLARVKLALEGLEQEPIFAFVELLMDARARGASVFIIGNGGSASTASHMATDLGVGSQRVGAGVRAISLTDNIGALTATGNDLAFENIFSTQLQLLGRGGDVLVAISASGNSPNLVKAAVLARNLSITVVGITGFSGGRIAEVADISIHVPTSDGDYGPAEDAHMVLNHMVTELLRSRVGAVPAGQALHG